MQLQARCAQRGPGMCPLAGWEDPPSHPPTGTGRSLRIGSMLETKDDGALLCLCTQSSTEALTCQACWPWGQLPSKTVLVHECVLQKSWHHLKTTGCALYTSVTGHMGSILSYSGEHSGPSQPTATLNSHWDAQSQVPVGPRSLCDSSSSMSEVRRVGCRGGCGGLRMEHSRLLRMKLSFSSHGVPHAGRCAPSSSHPQDLCTLCPPRCLLTFTLMSPWRDSEFYSPCDLMVLNGRTGDPATTTTFLTL